MMTIEQLKELRKTEYLKIVNSFPHAEYETVDGVTRGVIVDKKNEILILFQWYEDLTSQVKMVFLDLDKQKIEIGTHLDYLPEAIRIIKDKREISLKCKNVNNLCKVLGNPLYHDRSVILKIGEWVKNHDENWVYIKYKKHGKFWIKAFNPKTNEKRNRIPYPESTGVI